VGKKVYFENAILQCTCYVCPCICYWHTTFFGCRCSQKWKKLYKAVLEDVILYHINGSWSTIDTVFYVFGKKYSLCLKSRSSGLWHHAVLQEDTDVMEDLSASIYREKWNVSVLLQMYMVLQPRRPQLESSWPWKRQISNHSNLRSCIILFVL
jgi:hypothetical protein